MTALLRYENISKSYNKSSALPFIGKPKRVLEGITFSLEQNQTLGIVGESGCGKSTLGRLAARLIRPTAGNIYFDGQDITSISENAFRPLRKKIQIVLQDPHNALDPSFSIGESIGEASKAQYPHLTRAERMDRIAALLLEVGLDPTIHNRRPHELSGGQKQRVGIARAIAVNPSLIIADEAVAALDVSVQAHILNLMRDLQQKMKMSYLFISHDLSIVKRMSDRVAVMYKGRIVELSSSQSLFKNPIHPYTKSLINSFCG
ncbi:hypothetical protein BAR24_03360 [Gluconobacter oxydans]|uniref:ATP-binding cassette domain-containing protein n=1 Tax=Gluconobacter thailandicus TaxID=257438 RepID=UPI00029989DD|nr:ATP-binding cassette domain-containing protein [Gluconobacter thailandicus]AFW00720.1 ABC transporter ATP-binding protein [Gluconobacter oxydans H24]ANQ40587.1 hypothetical protein BAR24_03360 [Gluconobacter oxydans]